MKLGMPQHYHPLAAARMFRRYWLVLLLPLPRALLAWQLDALWLAVRQDAALLCFIIGYTLLVWYRTDWCVYGNDTQRTLRLRRGVLLRQELEFTPEQLAIVWLAHSFPLRLVGASRVILYPKAPIARKGKFPYPVRLLLRCQDANTLAEALFFPLPPLDNPS